MQTQEHILGQGKAVDTFGLQADSIRDLVSLLDSTEANGYRDRLSRGPGAVAVRAEISWDVEPELRGPFLDCLIRRADELTRNKAPEAATRVCDIADQIIALSNPDWFENEVADLSKNRPGFFQPKQS